MRLLVPGLASVVLTLGLLGPARAQPQGFDPDAVYQVPLAGAPQRGPHDAPITIVAWSDFACRFCNKAEATLEQLERLYPGKVRWVFRHLPLDDEDGTLAAEASLAAAAQGKFWPMKQRLFAVRGRVDRPAVELIASDLGLELMRFRGDLDAGTYRAQVAADVGEARTLGISGTPMFFVNGRPLRGNQPMVAFVTLIDAELARVRAASLPAGTDVHAAVTAGGRARADVELSTPRPPELDEGSSYAVGLGLPGHQDGPDDALVTIVEFADFECGYCVRNAPTLARLRQELPRDVRVVYRHLPLVFHRRAALAAEAAVAAAEQGKFWPFHHRLMTEPGSLDRADLRRHAQAVGLDLPRFERALAERRHREAVAADAAAGAALGIDGTPTTFINGTPVIGAKPYDQVRALVDAQIGVAQSLMTRGVARADVYALLMLDGTRADKADPARIPTAGNALELGAIEREQAVTAACRRRDPGAARALAGKLCGRAASDAAEVCAGVGVDLEAK